jgi:hypothetical protein
MIESEKLEMALEYEQYFRNKIADEILELQKPEGQFLTSVFALLWIKKCADKARGIYE